MGVSQLDLYIDADEEGSPRLSNTPNASPFRLADLSTNNVHITVLDIRNAQISAIPSSVQKLNLKQLILSHNKLEEVPSCLYSGLQCLQLLDLSHNRLSNFDIEPACTGEIMKLYLGGNKIQSFPHWILTVHCPKLQEVCYSGNFLIKLNTARQLGIKKLEMCNCHLMDVDFPFLKGLKTLEFLDISNDSSGKNENRFKEMAGFFTRPKWKNLRILKLNNVLLSVIPEEIVSQASLVELHLVNCELTWVPPEIQCLHNLRLLDISNNHIYSLPPPLTSLPSLSVVRAPFNAITSVSEFHKQLEILDLYSNKLEEISFNIDTITWLDLEQNYLDTTLLEDTVGYVTKRDEFRQQVDATRIDGPIEYPEDQVSDSGPESFHGDDVDHTSQVYESDHECWDDPRPPAVEVSKNPEVTTSDDEWTGSEKGVKRRQRAKMEFDAEEEWIFQDAEEE